MVRRRPARAPVAVLGLSVLLATPGSLRAAAPVISDFVSTPTIAAPGETVSLQVDAYDPDCGEGSTCEPGFGVCFTIIDAGKTVWSASDGAISNIDNGSTRSPYSASAEWTAPSSDGTYSVTVSVTDYDGFGCSGTAATTSASLDIQVFTVPVSDPPVIDHLSADPTQLLPTGTSVIECHATDPEGTAVTYGWSTSSGSLSEATVTDSGGSKVTLMTGGPGLVGVTCRATDADGVFTTSTVNVAVTEALAERGFGEGLVSPQRLAIDSLASVYVVDPLVPGLAVFNLFTGEPVYHLPVAGATSVAVDWLDRLLVGVEGGGKVVDRYGGEVLSLQPSAALGDVSDVAVDPVNRRYALLFRKVGRVVVFDELGTRIGSFGSTGDDPAQFKSPQGLAATPEGKWVVADTGHDQVKIFTAAGDLESFFPDPLNASHTTEFVRLADVEVLPSGAILASDSFQDWVLSHEPDGTPRDALGSYGDDVGQLKTASGIAVAGDVGRVVVASLNGSKLQVFRTVDEEAVEPLWPLPQLSTDSLFFPPQEVGAPPVTRSVRLSNLGTALLGVREVSVEGPFTQTNDCPDFLAPEELCTIVVSAGAGEAGELSGMLRITTSQGGTLTVELVGLMENPALANLDPLGLQFSDTEVGATSGPLPVTLANLGGRALSLLSVAPSTADWTLASDCPAVLEPGASCTFQVSFGPQTVGSLTGSLVVTTNAPGSPHQVSLAGLALEPPPVEISVADVEAEEGTDAEAVFEISLSREDADPVVVEFTTVSGTATGTSDFTERSGLVTFAAGETLQQLAVTVVDDDLFERERERFTLQLSNPVNGVLVDGEATGTIVDDELCVGPDLVENRGAEVLTVDDGLTAWTQLAGDWQRVGGDDAAEGLGWFGSGGAERAELFQEIDVTAFSGAIDRGEQWFAFEGWVRTMDDDSARIVLEYRGFNGELLGSFDSGVVTGGVWTPVPLEATDTRLAPRGTRRMRVRLIGHHLAGGTTAAQFDALSLRSLRALTVVLGDAEGYEGDVGSSVITVPVSLGCAVEGAVRIDVRTVDSTAREGQDYAAWVGSVEIASGAVGAAVDLTAYGDLEIEGHEALFLDVVGVDPGDAVVLDARSEVRILDDDVCPRGQGHWKNHPVLWPVRELQLGAVVYPQDFLLQLLDYGGKSTNTKLAAALAATKLNLASGTPPVFEPSSNQDPPSFDVRSRTERADELLSLYPLGTGSRSNPARLPAEVEAEMTQIIGDLAAYNEGECV